ncbi:hypothetical protein Ancab_014384 [Ancistrocladus abbreviatus]
MEAMRMKLVIAVVMMLIAVFSVQNAAAAEAPAPSPTSDASLSPLLLLLQPPQSWQQKPLSSPTWWRRPKEMCSYWSITVSGSIIGNAESFELATQCLNLVSSDEE